MLVIAEHIKCRSPIDRHRALPESLDALIRHRVDLLTQYQDGAYATQYEKAVNKVRDVEDSLNIDSSPSLTEAVARNLAKLMAYKDEYDVARLYSDPAFLQKLRDQFDGETGKITNSTLTSRLRCSHDAMQMVM